MKKQALIFTAIVVILMTLTSFAFAGNCNGKRNRGNRDCPRYMNGPGQQWAALTQEQKTQIMNLRQEFVDETAPQRVIMVSKHEAIRILMETTSPDQDQLLSLAAELADAQKIMMTKGIEFALKVKAIAPELKVPMMFNGMGKGMGMFEGRGKFHGPQKGRHHYAPRANCPRLLETPAVYSGDEKIPADEATPAAE